MGAIKVGAEMTELVAWDGLDTWKINAATRCSAALHYWPGEVVDVSEISERNKNKLKELFHIFEAEGRRP